MNRWATDAGKHVSSALWVSEEPRDTNHNEGTGGHDPWKCVGDSLSRSKGGASGSLGESDGRRCVDDGDRTDEGCAVQEQSSILVHRSPCDEQTRDGTDGADGN